MIGWHSRSDNLPELNNNYSSARDTRKSVYYTIIDLYFLAATKQLYERFIPPVCSRHFVINFVVWEIMFGFWFKAHRNLLPGVQWTINNIRAADHVGPYRWHTIIGSTDSPVYWCEWPGTYLAPKQQQTSWHRAIGVYQDCRSVVQWIGIIW